MEKQPMSHREIQNEAQRNLIAHPVYDLHRSQDRQTAVQAWAIRCFGEAHAHSLPLRSMRLLEEAAELAQAAGLLVNEAHKTISHVYRKEPGNIGQELGGVGVTMLAMAAAAGLSAELEEITEVERILSLPEEHFRARNQAKLNAGLTAMETAVQRENTSVPLYALRNRLEGACEDLEPFDELGRVARVIDSIRKVIADIPMVGRGSWRCFHCDRLFTSEAEAEAHFGSTKGAIARCIEESVGMANSLAGEPGLRITEAPPDYEGYVRPNPPTLMQAVGQAYEESQKLYAEASAIPLTMGGALAREIPVSNPSAADLDAVASEDQIRAATEPGPC